MKVTGIIAEYNPFHRGHAYHIEQAKKLTGADAVVVTSRNVAPPPSWINMPGHVWH